jgi:hypothetical protein
MDLIRKKSDLMSKIVDLIGAAPSFIANMMIT